MNLKFKIYSCLIFLLTVSFWTQAQVEKSIPVTGDWESAGVLYKDEYVVVELEFKLSKENCDSTNSGNSNHYFRYIVEGLKKPLGFDKFLTFKIVYQDCFGRLICKTNNLNIGVKKKNDVWDGVQPISDPNLDNFFRGSKLVIPFMEVRTSLQKDPSKDSECYKKSVTIPANLKSKKQNIAATPSAVTSSNLATEQANSVTSSRITKPEASIQEPSKSTSSPVVTRSRKTDLRIKGPTGNVVKGQKIKLELSDPGDNEWNWYEESCNGSLLKTGSSFVELILLESTTIYARPIVNNSNKEICLNYFVFVDSTASLSVTPSTIIVNNKGNICKGDTAKLYQVGGSLGTDANWTWFVKGENSPIFVGDTLKVVPDKTTTYVLKAIGKYNTSDALEVVVKINDFNFSERKIDFSIDQALCPNQSITIKMVGPSSIAPMDWLWENEKGDLLHRGTSEFKFKSPISTEIYAKYLGCSDPKIYSKTYEVNAGSLKPDSYSVSAMGNLSKVVLKGGKLMNGSRWVVYDEVNKIVKVFFNKEFTLDDPNKTYRLRAEGNCDTTEFLNINLKSNKQQPSKFYFNVGFSLFPGSPKLSERTFIGTLGVLGNKGGVYVTVKKDIGNDVGNYQTSNTSIANFPTFNNQYYLYNNQVVTNRLSVMAGMHVKLTNGVYWNIGGGYGKRDVLWGVDIKSTTEGNLVRKDFALNNQLSQGGFEVGTGFTLSTGGINVRIDGSITGSGAASNPYGELSVGLGLTF